jgi:hypothetical protein
MAMTVRRYRQCGAPSPARGRLDLLGPVTVSAGDYFHHVTVGVVEIDAATAVQGARHKRRSVLGCRWVVRLPGAAACVTMLAMAVNPSQGTENGVGG